MPVSSRSFNSSHDADRLPAMQALADGTENRVSNYSLAGIVDLVARILF
jgi:hypothetical protein